MEIMCRVLLRQDKWLVNLSFLIYIGKIRLAILSVSRIIV